MINVIIYEGKQIKKVKNDLFFARPYAMNLWLSIKLEKHMFIAFLSYFSGVLRNTT